MTATAVMPPIHPGEVLLTEFLEPLGIERDRPADALDRIEPLATA